ncbi:MAG: alpha-2-macroglobulin [Chitinophagales bacterium]
MRLKHPVWITCGLIIFLYACNRNLVRLDYTNAKDEVPALTNLTFRFDKSLVNDSLTNHWDSTRYISFDPAIPGKFRWEHTDELIFSPSAPLSPATHYKATLNGDILQYSKYDHFKNADEIFFHTPLLKLENTNAAWVLPDENSNLALPQIDLYFNYPVDPAALKDKMKLSTDGKPASFMLQTLSPSARISLRLTGIKMEDKDYETKISLDKGLVPVGGNIGTTQATEISERIPSPFVLRVNEVSANQEGLGGTIQVFTSQQVSATDLTSYIKIHPSVKFNAEITENGFQIHSDQFDTEKSYQITLNKGLHGKIGGTLQEDYFNNITFGELEPAIRFANSKGIYLSAKGEKNIEIRIINVPKVKLVISKIYENNLLSAQRNGYNPQETTGENAGYDDEDASVTAGDVIYEQEVDTRLLPKYGNSRIFHFDIQDKLPDFKGIYHILIRSAKDYWVRDSRFLSLSDIGLIAKDASDNMVVFANSIQTALPLKGVNIIAYGANNQVLGMAATNDSGVAEIKYNRHEFTGFRPAMVIARSADDFNYLPFNNTKVNTSRFEVGGKNPNGSGLDAFIYPERDIYRPGEKINYSVIVRDYTWHSPGEIPMKLKFLLPNGKDLKTFRKSLNEQGSLEGNIELPVTAITGSYSLEVYTSNDVLLNAQPFRVEEFVPDRIKVTAKLDKDFLEPGNTGLLSIHADNFFGPPAVNRNYECEIQLKQKSFAPKKYSNYDFSLTNQKTFYDKVVREGKTNAEGNATEKYEVQEMYRNIGLLQADFYTTVFDETGRPVSRLTSTNIYTQPHYFGIADDGNWYYALNQPVRFPLIALDKSQTLLNGIPASVSVIKHEYRTVLSKSGSFFRYESQKEDKLISSSTTTVSGEQTAFTFIPRSPGEYEIRVALPGANSYVSKSFYSYGYGGSDQTSFEVNNEGHVDIQLNKTSYYNGENVKALFKAPFDGRLLVTLETAKLISYQYVSVENRTATINLKLTAGAIPNAYITATLIKPHGISDIPLTVAHGFENIKVEEKSRKIPVEIVASPTVRSKTHQEITVKAAPNSMVTLAAVDNGVLQVSGFQTPDPYGYFYAQRALAVDAYDLYPLLLPELKARLSSTGGDTETDMTKRTNPMPARRIKILSYWSGIKQADDHGVVHFQLDIPQFSGEVRLMAVSYHNERFGSGESRMTVADPLVLSTALPRFLTPSDSALVPLTITNTTLKTATGSAILKTSGGLAVAGGNQQDFTLLPNSEKRLYFSVIAKPEMGTGKVNVLVNGLGEKFTDETEISVRPAASLQKNTGSGMLKGGTNLTMDFDKADFIPSSISSQLLMSRFPGAGLGKYLADLLQYPYGCTEQTVSAAFPQLYFGDLADALQRQKGAAKNANYNVQEAIRKIKMRQLYNGAVTLWDDEGSASWWTTIYAAHFLIEAGKAGFDVDKGLLETMLGYIDGQMRDRKTINYYYNRNQQKKIVPKEVIYGLYVLALAGKPNLPVMNYYKANPSLLSLDCKYLLAAAYAITGDRNSYRQFLPTQFTGEESVARTGGSFYSDIRDEAIALNVLVDVDPENAQIPVMAKHVADKLKQRSWYSTQELAFGFLALGKIAKQQGASEATAEIRVNGKAIAHFTGTDLRINPEQLKSGNPEIISTGKGNIYYYWEQEGISASGAMKESDNFLRVRKRFFNRYGTPVSGTSFKQNELLIVQISIEKSFSGDVENVVITDLLPAGFEIENPRTKEIPGMDWIKDDDKPTALDVRDDRINLFVNLYNAKQTYYYAARAVSPGVFKMGAVSADAMYNGEYHSYNGGGLIRITE